MKYLAKLLVTLAFIAGWLWVVFYLDRSPWWTVVFLLGLFFTLEEID